MIALRKYKDIRDTLIFMKLQIVESIPYAEQTIPNWVNTPRDLWDWLKPKFVYYSDPPGTELLQTMQTLFEGTRNGTPGAGDCDCFVITVTSCLNVLGLDNDIVLAGRKKSAPVHIYNKVYDNKGNEIVLDFTEPLAGMERFYPYKQYVNANINF